MRNAIALLILLLLCSGCALARQQNLHREASLKRNEATCAVVEAERLLGVYAFYDKEITELETTAARRIAIHCTGAIESSQCEAERSRYKLRAERLEEERSRALSEMYKNTERREQLCLNLLNSALPEKVSEICFLEQKRLGIKIPPCFNVK